MIIQVTTNERTSFVGVLHINNAITQATIAVTFIQKERREFVI